MLLSNIPLSAAPHHQFTNGTSFTGSQRGERGLTMPSWIALAFGGCLLPVQAQVTIDVVAEAHNSPGLVELQNMDPAVIRGGNIAFTGNIHEGQFNSRRIIRLNGINAVLGSGPTPGQPAPGTSSTFTALNTCFVNAAGQIAFSATTNDNNQSGFWVGFPGSLQKVARNGEPAPGTNGNFRLGEFQAFNDAGQVAFSAQIVDAPSETADGVWAGAPVALQLVARTGSQAPGFPAGVTWNYVSATRGEIQLNSAGQVGISGRVSLVPPADTYLTDGYVLMVGQPGALRVLAKAGDPAPGAEPFTFVRLSDGDFTLNSAGQAAYITDIWSGKFGLVPASKAIYFGSVTEGSQLVARTQYPAPGLADGAYFSGFDNPLLNDAGEVAFTSFVASPTNPSGKAIWLGKPGKLRKVVRTDDVAPGTGGQLFGDFPQNTLLLSNSGQVAFMATYSPGGGLYGNNATTGIFATDKTGSVQFIARIGAAIGTGPVIGGLEFAENLAANGDGRRSSLDRDGRLVFRAAVFATQTSSGKQLIYRATFPEAAPVILPTGQPTSVRASIGGSAVLEATALGSRPAGYQWQRNGVNIPGATSASLQFNSLTGAESGTYTVVIANPYGSTTSNPAQLSFPPVLTTQPQDQQANAGTAVTLSAAASGPLPLTWQWQFKAAGAPDFVNVSGATDATLTLTNIAAAQTGRYRAIVSNSGGSTTSRDAVVTVAAVGAPLVKRIFIPGDPVTGISGALLFSKGEDPVINNAGEIAFEGNVGTDPSSPNLGSYFRSTGGNYRFVTRLAHDLNLSDGGGMAQDSNRAIEFGPPDSLQILARPQMIAPDGAGTYTNEAGFSVADDGTTAFLFGTHLSNYAIFAGKFGAVRLLARSNTAAPGAGAGVVFAAMADPVINPSGTTAFWASLGGTGITTDNDTSLWKNTLTGVQRIVAEDELVPAAGSGVRVGDIRLPDAAQSPFGWNEAGQVAFSTTLAGTGINSSNDKAILAGTPGALALAGRAGVANGHTFSFPRAPFPLINRTGQVAFVATVTPTGTSDFLESVWRWNPGTGGGTRQLIAREGQQAPGLPAGVVMDSDLLGRPFFSCSLNGAGQIVLTTRLAGPGISFDAGNDVALYLTNAAGDLKLVARTGGMIDLGGGEQRELSYITVALGSGGEDGRPRSITESGEVVFSGGLKRTGSFVVDYGLFTARLAPDTTALAAAYSTWAATAFPAGSGTAVTRADADPDKDGNLNAIEYLMGSNPASASASALTLLSESGGLGFTFPRRPGVPDGFEIIESTAALEGPWTPVPRTAIRRTPNSAGQPDTVTVELPAGEGKRFVRVRVTL